MSGSLFGLVLVVGPVFGVLGAAAAYVITYEEYSHHSLGRRRTMLLSLRTAVVTFLALLLLSLAVALVLTPR